MAAPKRRPEVEDEPEPPKLDPAIRRIAGMRADKLRKVEAELNELKRAQEHSHEQALAAQERYAMAVVAIMLKALFLEMAHEGRYMPVAELERWRNDTQNLKAVTERAKEEQEQALNAWRSKIREVQAKVEEHRACTLQVEKMKLLEEEMLGQG